MGGMSLRRSGPHYAQDLSLRILEGADLRDLRLGGVELVRRLYFALRDENWDTIPAAVGEPLHRCR